MGDKEPRRRKKRRDSQKKDEIRTDDQTFASTKSESRDSDQEVEEEIVITPHQTSNLSKLVFVILFSGLVVSLSVIFISLRDSDKGPVDISDLSHDDHDEALHDNHIDEVFHDHDEHDDDHGEDEVSLKDMLGALSSIFSINKEHNKESESFGSESIAEKVPHEEPEELRSGIIVEPESSTDQGVLEEYIEDSVESYTPEPPIEEPASSERYAETLTTSSYTEDESTYSTLDYSESEDFTEENEGMDENESQENEDMEENESEENKDMDSTTLEPYNEDEPLDEVEDDETTIPEANTLDDGVLDDIEDSFSLYERADITNEADFNIKDQLDEIDSVLEKSTDKALEKCNKLLEKHPVSPRLHYMKAQALDKLAELHRSNKYLEEAITAYQTAMSCENIPENLYLLAGRRAADRLRFRGFTGKSVKLLAQMAVKFPSDVDLKNQVAVGYLLIGQNKMAKETLLDVMRLAPDSGVAKVHLGFILKTDESNYKESIRYLSEGIASREPGVIDGRFYFHLGDALHRTGKKEEALKVYEEAVKEGLFLSVYQRSLYNINGLTGKPWWEPRSTRYAPDFKILEKNWITIRDEALSLLDEKYAGFMSETEGLQEKGDWKQLELYARGRRLEKNCQNAPKTCAIIAQIPDAATCKRGQAKFSIMDPGTHVWAHTGPTNCRLRSHLGLVVPEGVSIRVAEETRKWEEGKVILFDDSFEHEVWHNGSTYRLVLIVDFWHPELTVYQKKSLTPI